MTLKIAVVRKIIQRLNERYPFICREIVVGEKFHIHANPKRRLEKANETKEE
jgi:hypothetical protein